MVYGARTGSDGSGTIPRRVGKLVEEDLQRLKALEPTNSLLVASPQWGGVENLEVRNTLPPRLHASSPLDQRVPLIDWTSPINNYSDLSSVPHGSVERSIPSTLLTSPNFSSTVDNSNSSRTNTRSQRSIELPSLRTIHEGDEPRVSVVQAEVYPTATPQARSHRQPALGVRSRFADLGLPMLAPGQQQTTPKDVEKELDWRRTTYRDADSLFPNYALNYPAPIHGNLSPSLQYPDQVPPRFGFEDIGVVPSSSYYQNPLATSSPPRTRSNRVLESGYLDMSRTVSVPPNALASRVPMSPGHHDYENTRYCSHRPSSEAPPLYVAPASATVPDSGRQRRERHRKTAVIDGAVRRIRPGQLPDASGRYSVQRMGTSGVPGWQFEQFNNKYCSKLSFQF